MLEHVYYWAWSEEDNPQSYATPEHLKKYRVFRAAKSSTRGIPMTETMSREESRIKCEEIVRLTQGKGY
jgi:hypothetical protein